MANQHKHPPIAFRPGEYRARLLEYARGHGIAVNAVIRQAVAEFLDRRDADVTRGLDGTAVRPRAHKGERS